MCWLQAFAYVTVLASTSLAANTSSTSCLGAGCAEQEIAELLQHYVVQPDQEAAESSAPLAATKPFAPGEQEELLRNIASKLEDAKTGSYQKGQLSFAVAAAVDSTKKIKACLDTQGGGLKQTCDKAELAHSLLGLASNAMLLFNVVPVVGPLLAGIGQLICGFFMNVPAGTPPLTADMVKKAVLSALSDVAEMKARIDLQAAEGEIMRNLDTLINAGNSNSTRYWKSFKKQTFPQISQDMNRLSTDLDKAYQIVFGVEDISSRKRLTDLATVKQSCAGLCAHNGADWPPECDRDGNTLMDDRWPAFKRSVQAAQSALRIGPFMVTIVLSIYDKAGWPVEDDEQFQTFMIRMQTILKANDALSNALHELGTGNSTNIDDVNPLRDGAEFPQKCEVAGKRADEDHNNWLHFASEMQCNFPEMVSRGTGPMCGTNPKGWCDGGKGYTAFIGATKYWRDGDYGCPAAVDRWANTHIKTLKYFAHSGNNPAEMNFADWQNVCGHCTGAGCGIIECGGIQRAGICMRREVCANDKLVSAVWNVSLWMDYQKLPLPKITFKVRE